MMETWNKVKESNRIEGITRNPSTAELDMFEWFMSQDKIEVYHLENFVKVYQPDARLRLLSSDIITVGSHMPPTGGQKILYKLQALLDEINKIDSHQEAWDLHIQYEMLHPFTDGNGRSGRMLWYWMMYPAGARGFLHEFYYQTLRARQGNKI